MLHISVRELGIMAYLCTQTDRQVDRHASSRTPCDCTRVTFAYCVLYMCTHAFLMEADERVYFFIFM